MKELLLLVGLLLQLGLALLAFIWQLAFLGFADEAHRSHSANLLGKCLVGVCLLVGAVPIGLSLWVGWCYYFSPTAWSRLPLGYLLPLGSTLVCGLMAAGLIYLFNTAGYPRK